MNATFYHGTRADLKPGDLLAAMKANIARLQAEGGRRSSIDGNRGGPPRVAPP